ncbi:MAG: hypothetical protein RIE84_11175 [Parvibaculum sp.]|uniref:hypothetical protein n=1 Tax=Parvibaculum sp. TaxID=2024848 RepID=UPI0032EC79DB
MALKRMEIVPGVLAAMIAAAGPVLAAEDFGEALLGGKPIIDLRLRYEHVEQDGVANNADAYTGRARLGYETGSFHGFTALTDFDLVGHVGPEDYNDTVNGRTSYPVVADPDTAELNRLQIAYDGLPDTAVTLGRQRIILGNARFVGNVGWRQNEQTFDALRVVNSSVDGLSLGYTYLNRVNRVFGEDSPVGRFRGDTHLVNADYTGFGGVTLGAYAYLLDLNEAPALSTETYGARLSLPLELAERTKLALTGEYANQTDYEGNPASVDLDYMLAEAAFSHAAFGFTAGYEVLEGDGAVGFSTPLATLHAFNGWADVFLTTPAAGLEDFYLGATYALNNIPAIEKLVLGVTWHDFSAERGGADFGDELDMVANFVLSKNLSLNLKFASFDGENGFASRDKTWLSLTYAY